MERQVGTSADERHFSRAGTSAWSPKACGVVRRRLTKKDLTDAVRIHPRQEATLGEPEVPVPALGLGFIDLR